MDRIIVVGLMVLAFPYAATHPVVDAREMVPDSIQTALDQGRFWKASMALRDHLGPLTHLSTEERVLLARAEAGWNNWPGALEVLTEGSSDPGDAEPEYWYLLGGARQQGGDLEDAVEAYSRYLSLAPGDTPESLVAGSRVIQNQARTRPWPDLEGPLSQLRARSPVTADWTALALARGYRDAGRPEDVVRALASIIDPSVADRGWDLESLAWVERGDTLAAITALDAARSRDLEGVHSVSAASLGWPLHLSVGDTDRAVEDLVEVLENSSRGSRAVRAAQALLKLSDESQVAVSQAVYLKAASILAPAEHPRDALRAWDRATELGATLAEGDRLARAGALNAAGRVGESIEEYRSLQASSDSRIGAPALRSWSRIRTRQGRHGDARILSDRLVERYPSSPEALDVVFFRGDDFHDAGRLDLALDHYERVVGMSPSANRAGLARMRWAQIHLERGEFREAAEVYEGYLADFPRGRRWEEASFWGAWAWQQAGEMDAADRLVGQLESGNPVSYYAVAARELTDNEVGWAFPEGNPLPDPEWLHDEIVVLRVLREAGLEEGADAHVAAMKAVAWDSDDLLMKLAVELVHNGRSMDGINLGWELRRRGRDWSRRLLEVVYPFPYRDVVLAFAHERQLDPFLVAGLIRQESAFVPDIVSHAGAIGLMQVMPATGTELARSIGPSQFHPDVLKTPEVNVHLGTRFLADALARYDQDLPLVLSAYNAGPTRANRWKNFPEARDPWRFTERIPFAETRAYVKNVTRNRSLYSWLYSDLVEAADLDR